MLVLPAIDVRAVNKAFVFGRAIISRRPSSGPIRRHMAQRRVGEGAPFCTSWISTGPAGRPINGASVRAIVAAAGVPCQLGGGLRSQADIKEALGWGVRDPGDSGLQGSSLVRKRVPALPRTDRPGPGCPPGTGGHQRLAGGVNPAGAGVPLRLCGLAVGGPGVHGH